jgi:serine/threonine-protein kinase
MESSHPSALPDWSAVPSDSEEDRRFLNRRLAYFGAVIFVLSNAFLVLNIVMGLAMHESLLRLDRALHLSANLVFGVEWLLCRRGKRSAAELNGIDVGSTVLGLGLFALMATVVPAQTEPGGARLSAAAAGLVLTLITVSTVVTRAVIVPGTARRSFWVSAVACLPGMIAAYRLAGYASDARPGLWEWVPLVSIANMGTWSLVAVAMATLNSRIIYGLAQRVRAANELGQYTLEEKIGEGGMGVVYRARHALLRRPTAVKLLPRELAGARSIERFEREVQLTSALAHPNTIAIYDYGRTPDGVFYYAMEYLEGITLEQLVAHDGPQPAARVIHLLKQVCGALQEAHEIELIHRDVKPANIMICVRGGVAYHVKVLDFGLVKQVAGGSPGISSDEAVVGTPKYIAPEAITSPSRVDARADLYAVGGVGYELLTGAPVFEGSTVIEVCTKILHETPKPPSERAGRPVPEALERLILACLAKDRSMRPASAAEIVDALEVESQTAPWSASDAKRWWQERAPAVLSAVAARRSRGVLSGSRTIAVDLMDRS